MKNKFSILLMLLFSVSMIFMACGGGSAPSDKQIEKDVEAFWKSTYPNQTILEMTIVGEPFEAITVVDGVERMMHNQMIEVLVERQSGEEKTYTMSANYLGNSNGKNFQFNGCGTM